MADPALYHCTNPACTLGVAGQPGRFTHGMTAEHQHLLTGRPLESLKDGKDYGKGVCPNCGKLGVKFDPKKED